MTTILKRVKRASLPSYRLAASRARLRVAVSMDKEQLPSEEAIAAFAAQAQRYRPHVVSVTQDLSVLQARYSN